MRDMVANDPKQFEQRGGTLYQAELVSKSEKLRNTTVASVESGVIHKTADKTAIEAAMEYVNNLPEHVFQQKSGILSSMRRP